MATMKSFRIHDFGGPDVLKEDEVPVPHPQDDDLLVQLSLPKTSSASFATEKRIGS